MNAKFNHKLDIAGGRNMNDHLFTGCEYHVDISAHNIINTLVSSVSDRNRGPHSAEAGRADHGGALADTVMMPPSSGLRYTYLIDADGQRRNAIHKMISGESNMIIRVYRTHADFLEEIDDLDAGCVILFVDTDRRKTREFIRSVSLHQRYACLALAQECDVRTAIEAMKMGAADCLLYPCEGEEIRQSINDVQETVRHAVAVNNALHEARRQVDRLTAREKDVLHGLVQGKSNKMIALDLQISPRTVEIYRAHLMEKLGTSSLSDTLKIAFAAGVH